MEDISRKVAQVVAAIRLHWSEQPRVGLVLGSGLGSLANRIIDPVAIDYTDLPHFAQATALGHEGRLVCGWLRGYPVIAMQGRLHGYEGHPADRIAFSDSSDASPRHREAPSLQRRRRAQSAVPSW